MFRALSFSISLLISLNVLAKTPNPEFMISVVTRAAQLAKSQEEPKARLNTLKTLRKTLVELDAENSAFDKTAHQARIIFNAVFPVLEIKKIKDCDKARHSLLLSNSDESSLTAEIELAMKLLSAICN